MTTNSLDITWKLPSTSWKIADFQALHDHGETFFSNLLSDQIEESCGEYEPPADFQRYLHRQSLLLILYAFLEVHLMDLCDISADHFGKKMKIKDFKSRDKGIKKCRKYLADVIGISCDSFSNEWQFIIGLQRVRNAYVHRPDENKRADIRKIVEKSCGNLGVLPAEYIKKSIDIIGSFLHKLEGEIINTGSPVD